MNKWQRLRIARVQDVEPEHAQQVDDAFDLLAAQVAEDGKLYTRAREVLDTYRRTDRIDGFRYWSVRDVAKHSRKISMPSPRRGVTNLMNGKRSVPLPSRTRALHVIDVADEYTDRALGTARDRPQRQQLLLRRG